MTRAISRSDRIAARLAKLAGIPLSAEEYAAGDDLDLDNLNGQQARFTRTDDSDTCRLLRSLLRALGVEVAEQTGSELIALAARKIAELRGNKGAKGSAAGNTNPLIPSGEAEIEPMYMSFSRFRTAASALSAEDEARIVDEFARRMGAVPARGGAAFGVTDEEDRLADLLVSKMGSAAERRSA